MNKLSELVKPKADTCGYVWGSQGEILYPQTLKRLQATFGLSHYDFYDNGVHILASKWMNKQCFDCSGLIVWALQKLGKISKDADYNATMLYEDLCKPVLKANLGDGDLVFIKHDSGECSHVGIYIGNGEIIEARGTSAGVIKSKLFGSSFNTFGRLVMSLDDSEEIGIAQTMFFKGWITDKVYWANVLLAKEQVNVTYLAIVFNRMASLPDNCQYNEALDFLMRKQIITDRFYWEGVLQGKIVISNEYLKILINRAFKKL